MMAGKKPALRVLALLAIGLFLTGVFEVKKPWRMESLLRYDAAVYYTYLPAVFIYGDIDLHYPDSVSSERRAHKKINFETLPNGQRYIKTTMGLAYLYAPFFFLGHWKAGLAGVSQDGYSWPYENLLLYGTLCYLLLALALLARVLAAHFADRVVALSLATVVLGTNLLYYSTLEGLHVHAYNFSLFCYFLYGVHRYFQRPALWKALVLGLLLGLIALIRPTNILIGLLVPLYGVGSWADFKGRLVFLLKNVPSVLVFAAAFILPWIPQFAYWQHVSGQWLFFSYGASERFFWTDPKFLYGFFSYRKGLLLYTPVLAFAFLGLLLVRRHAPAFFIFLLFFIPLNCYIMFSWWSWWYGGSYGMRPAIDSYGLMAIPLAAFFSWVFRQKTFLKTGVMVVWGLLMGLGLFQTWQYNKGIIHWDAMTKEAYWAVFLKSERPAGFEELLQIPSNEKASQGIDEYKQGKR